MLSGNEFRNLARQQGVAILDKGNETDFLKEIEQTGLQQNISSFLKNSFNNSSPSFWKVFRSLRRIAAILALARAVVANTSHWGCTRCDLDVSDNIS